MLNKNYINQEQDRRISSVEQHITTINAELGDIKADIKGIKTDLSWLKKNYWVIAGAAISGVIVGLINLLFSR